MRTLPHGVTSLCERKFMNRSVMRVPTDTHVANTVMKWISDPEIRKKMYIAANTCARDNLYVRSTMLCLRLIYR